VNHIYLNLIGLAETMNLQNVKQITITCSDGESLAATAYQPTITAIGAVMIAPATGIKRQIGIKIAGADLVEIVNNG
jgi:predicted alpha/beta hydrolase